MAANSLTLAWSASTGTAPITYQPLFRLTGSNSFLSFGSPVSGLSVVVTGLVASTGYDFEITATNGFGSATSTIASGATSSGSAFPAPGNVTGTQNTGSTTPVITGPQNGTDFLNTALAVTGLTITDAAATTGTLVVSCTSGNIGMTLNGQPITNSTPTTTFDDEFTSLPLHQPWQTGDKWQLIAPDSQTGRGGPNNGESGTQWWVNPFNASTPNATMYTIVNGQLQLQIQPTPAGSQAYINTQSGTTLPYEGGLLNTSQTNYQNFGYYEFAVAVNRVSGFGWLFSLENVQLTGHWPPEIDLLIYTDGANVQTAQFTINLAGGVITPSTWNPSDKGSAITLSSANSIATTNSTATTGVRSAVSNTSGKFYAEFTSQAAMSSFFGVGLATAAWAYTTTSIGSGTTSLSWAVTGTVYFNNVSIGTAEGTTASGTLISMAVDLTAGLVWFRVNAGNWNANSAANPATGVGGFAFTMAAGAVFTAFGTSGTVGDSVLRVGVGAFTGTIPNGFSAWDGSSAVGQSAQSFSVSSNAGFDASIKHVYGINWQSNAITFYIDGSQMYSTANPGGVYLTDQQFIFLATYANYPSGVNPAAASLPASVLIDYVRVYQAKPPSVTSLTLTDTFANVKAALASLIYIAPSSATIDTISVKFTDQAAANNTLLIQIQDVAQSVAVAPSAPTNLVAAVGSSNTVMQLSWAASATGTAPILYQPLYKLHTDATFIASGSPVSGLVATISGLSASTSYDFEVTASNSVSSATSVVVTASTTITTAAPSAPTSLQSQAATSTTLTMSWSPPTTGSSPITYQPMFRPSSPIAAGTRLWYQVIGGDRTLLTTPFQTTATWITSGSSISALRSLPNPEVKTHAGDGFVSPFWVSLSTSDPLCTFHDGSGGNPQIPDFQMHVPAGAYSENGFTNAGDNSAGFIDSSIPYKYVTFNDCRIGSNSSNASAGGVVSSTNNFIECGPGLGSPGGMIVQDATGPVLMDAITGSVTANAIWENGDNVSGCITYYDLQQCNANASYVIQHLLAVDCGVGVFSSSEQVVWPLVIGDLPGTGTIAEGAIFGIPASTVRPTGQTRGFYACFDVFQQFGGMFNNTNGSGQFTLKSMPGDTATNNLVLDMASQLGAVLQYMCVLNFTPGLAGAQYGISTLKGRLENATGWSDAFPAPPSLTFSQTNNATVLPSTFGAWQAANGLGKIYNSIWPYNLAALPFVAFGSPIAGTSVTITGLTPNTAYDVEIIAINSLGQATSAAVTSSTGITGIPSDAIGTQARPAQDMLNRFGINTHFGNGLYAAFTPAQGVAAIQTIGVTLIRDSDNG